jgi:2-C-methyl-D-erythritol 2,4-cyclodiphosphate synthase
VLLHAITDALLGAAGLSDIGELFPPSDEKWKGADSRELLKHSWNLVKEKGYKLGNLDCVIAIEKPKLLPFRKEIISSIANVLEVDESQVFVKAKTGEKLGEIGNGLAVAVWATCLLFQNSQE